MDDVRTVEPTRTPLVLRWASRSTQAVGRCHFPVSHTSEVGQVSVALPVQHVRVRGTRPAGDDKPLIPLPLRSPFDFSGHIRRLCEDIVRCCPELSHVRTSHILFGFTQARNGRSHGLQARVTPMRFRCGVLVRRYRGVPYQVQRFLVDGRDILYLMTFCLPRFLNQPFEDKLVTVFHELFHISPRFDGDLRRHEGRYSIHSHSQRRYDKYMAKLAQSYLADDPVPELHAFLRLNCAQIRARHGSIVGVTVPRPKLVPLTPTLF
jgi:Putative phage metallopeptidase